MNGYLKGLGVSLLLDSSRNAIFWVFCNFLRMHHMNGQSEIHTRRLYQNASESGGCWCTFTKVHSSYSLYKISSCKVSMTRTACIVRVSWKSDKK